MLPTNHCEASFFARALANLKSFRADVPALREECFQGVMHGAEHPDMQSYIDFDEDGRYPPALASPNSTFACRHQASKPAMRPPIAPAAMKIPP